MQLFHLHLLSASEAILSEADAQHCTRVLRHQVGDEIHGIDGAGVYYRTQIMSQNKREVRLQVLESIEEWGEKPQHITLALSPLHAKDRFEWALEKSVELGVNAIVPIVCKRTVTPNIRLDRMNAILLAALKQCKRSRLPLLSEPVPFAKWIATQKNVEALKLIAYCERGAAFPTQISNRVVMLIGPEGDFTPEEVSLAEQQGFAPLTLGTNRLRTETAAIHALSIAKFVGGW